MTNLLFMGGLGGLELLLLVFIFLFPLILWIMALVDLLKSEFKDSTDKLIWVLVILLLPIAGAFLYFIIGRKQKV